MSEIFNSAMDFVFRMEGGGTLHEIKHDAGGLTKWGISQRAYPQVDIRGLTEAKARDIYLRDYWTQCRCDDLPVAAAVVVFDAAVNMGVGRACRMLQRAVGANPDGVIGPTTMYHVGRENSLDLPFFFSARRQQFYNRVVRLNRSQSKFLDGWTNRTFKVLAFSQEFCP